MNNPEPPSGKSMVTSAQSTRLVDASITTAPAVGATVTDIGATGATLAEEETSSARTRLKLIPARSDKHNALINVLFICDTSNTKQQRRAHHVPAHLRFRNTQAECHAVVDSNVGLTHATRGPRKNIFGTQRCLLCPVVTQNGHRRDAPVRREDGSRRRSFRKIKVVDFQRCDCPRSGMPAYDTVNAVRKATAAEPQTILIPKGWRPPPSELRLCVFASLR